MSRSKVLGEKYKINDVIGQGGFSTVYSCTDIHTSKKYAVKVLNKNRVRELHMEEAFERETNALRCLKYSPYVTNVIDVLQSTRNYYIITDLANGGTLLQVIVRQGGLPQPAARKYFRQLILGLVDIHNSNVVHRDIKPDNLLLDEWRDIKISDFGFSAYSKPSRVLTRQCGTPQYVAPEVLQGSYYGRDIDIWSAGVTLYVMLFGRMPFVAADEERLFQKIATGKYPLPKRDGRHMATPAAAHLLAVMIRVDPKRRWPLSQLMKHPWVLGRDELPAAIPRQLAAQRQKNRTGGVGTTPPLAPAVVDGSDTLLLRHPPYTTTAAAAAARRAPHEPFLEGALLSPEGALQPANPMDTTSSTSAPAFSLLPPAGNDSFDYGNATKGMTPTVLDGANKAQGFLEAPGGGGGHDGKHPPPPADELMNRLASSSSPTQQQRQQNRRREHTQESWNEELTAANPSFVWATNQSEDGPGDGSGQGDASDPMGGSGSNNESLFILSNFAAPSMSCPDFRTFFAAREGRDGSAGDRAPHLSVKESPNALVQTPFLSPATAGAANTLPVRTPRSPVISSNTGGFPSPGGESTPQRDVVEAPGSRFRSFFRRISLIHLFILLNFFSTVACVLVAGALRVLFDVDINQLPLPGPLKRLVESALTPPTESKKNKKRKWHSRAGSFDSTSSQVEGVGSFGPLSSNASAMSSPGVPAGARPVSGGGSTGRNNAARMSPKRLRRNSSTVFEGISTNSPRRNKSQDSLDAIFRTPRTTVSEEMKKTK